jgi:hypothetical protein
VTNDFPAPATRRLVISQKCNLRFPQQISDWDDPVIHFLNCRDPTNEASDSDTQRLSNSEYLSQGSSLYNHLRTFSFFSKQISTCYEYCYTLSSASFALWPCIKCLTVDSLSSQNQLEYEIDELAGLFLIPAILSRKSAILSFIWILIDVGTKIHGFRKR